MTIKEMAGPAAVLGLLAFFGSHLVAQVDENEDKIHEIDKRQQKLEGLAEEQRQTNQKLELILRAVVKTPEAD